MWKRVKLVVHAWEHYECASLAAGVAFYAALSLFPVMMVLAAGVGYFFRFVPSGPSAREEILELLSRQMSVEFSEAMSKVLMEVQDGSLLHGPLAGLAFLFASTLVFAQVDRGFYRIWDVRRRHKGKGFRGALNKALSSRARSFAMIVAICFWVVALFIFGAALKSLGEVESVKKILLSKTSHFLSLWFGPVINVLILTFLYKFLSKDVVSWRISIAGAAVAALLWELGSRVLTIFSFGSNLSVYGLIGSFLVVLVWIYYTVMILFIGALIVRVEKKITGARRTREKYL